MHVGMTETVTNEVGEGLYSAIEEIPQMMASSTYSEKSRKRLLNLIQKTLGGIQ